MEKVILLDNEARINAEEKYIQDRTITMKDLKENLKVMYDLMEKYFPKKVKSQEKKIEDRTISLEELKENFYKLPREEQNSVLRQLDDVKAKNLKADRQKAFENLPEDIRAGVGMPKENLKMLTIDQRTALLKKLDDIVKIERNRQKEEVVQEAIK